MNRQNIINKLLYFIKIKYKFQNIIYETNNHCYVIKYNNRLEVFYSSTFKYFGICYNYNSNKNWDKNWDMINIDNNKKRKTNAWQTIQNWQG
jgi:hypothetical protein